MIRRELVILNKLGLHARAASYLVKVASGYRSQVTLVKDGVRANAKSIMGLLLLAAARGQRIEVIAEGDDEGPALDAVEELIRAKFHED